MSRPALPEERGADLRPELPTLEELRQAHDFEAEERDRYEPGDGARTVDVCRVCGYEQDARDRGAGPACPDEEIPERLIDGSSSAGRAGRSQSVTVNCSATSRAAGLE